MANFPKTLLLVKIQYARDDEGPHSCINQNKNIDDLCCSSNEFLNNLALLTMVLTICIQDKCHFTIYSIPKFLLGLKFRTYMFTMHPHDICQRKFAHDICERKFLHGSVWKYICNIYVTSPNYRPYA